MALEVFSGTSRLGFYTGMSKVGEGGFATIRIYGIEDIKRKLNQLSLIGQSKAADEAVKAGAKIVKDAIKRKAPLGTEKTLAGFQAMGVSGRTRIFAPGRLRRSITIRKPRVKKSDVSVRYQVGPDKNIAFYAHMVEFGTSQHTIKAKKAKILRFMRTSGFPYRPEFISEQTYATAFSSGKKVGGGVVFIPKVEVKARAHPFVRPGFDESKFRAIDTIKRQLLVAIEKANRARQSGWVSASYNITAPAMFTEF